ncbi:MAG: NAD(P)-dependent oxidoreductase [Cellulomonadaceae bacterium]|jgi:dTDP-6-deoxy-L-talose 4-dehydrogenase (NAD+)|nr:NAD(P)-dependent oxidoreductase [Cellulomonadaceae bacterium]
MSKEEDKALVLVTGAQGFLGQALVPRLLDAGANVIACDFSVDKVDTRATALAGNIFDPDSISPDSAGNPTHLVHLAWQDGFVLNSDAHMRNVSAHYGFLMRFISGGCTNVSVMGTMHEAGYIEGAIDENTVCVPLNEYGVAKNALRQSMLLRTTSLDVCFKWLRAYYIVSNTGIGENIFAKIIRAARDGKTTFPFTTGKTKYDFISIEDLADQITAAVLQTEEAGIINVCSGNPVSLADRIEQFITENNLDISLDYGAFPDRPFDSPITYGDATRIQKIMGTNAT